MKKNVILLASLLMGSFLQAQNVGIGTTAPEMQLHVATGNGALAIFENTKYPVVAGDNTRIFFRAAGLYYTGAIGTQFTTNSKARLGFFTSANDNPNDLIERLSITDEGSVGVANTVPTYTLDVSRGNGINGTAQFSGTTYNSIFNFGALENTYIRGGKATSVVYVNDKSSGVVSLAYGGGNVGIGSISPSEKLTVLTGANSLGISHTDGAIKIGTYVGGAGNGGYFGTISDNPLYFMTKNGSAQVTLLQSGNVGIGTISPSATLHVKRGTAEFGTAQFEGTVNSSHFNYSSGEETYIRGGKATSQVIINDVSTGNIRLAEGGGKVGIGTSLPTQKLTVQTGLNEYGISQKAGEIVLASYVGTSGVGAQGGWVGTQTNHPLYLYAGSGGRITLTTDGNVGIGTAVPTAKMDITTDRASGGPVLRVENSNTSSTTAPHAAEFYANGGSNAALVAVHSINSPNHSYARLGYAAPGLSQANIFGGEFYAVSTIATTTPMGIYSQANGGTFNYAAYLNGNVSYTGNLSQASDGTLKTNIHDYTNALQVINQLQVKQYEFKEESKKLMALPNGTHFGLIAQDLQKVLPNLVNKQQQPLFEKQEKSENGKTTTQNVQTGTKEYLGVNYIELIPILIKAVQEQQALITSLQKDNAELKTAVQVLTKK